VSASPSPIYVDLNRTLVRSSLAAESMMALIKLRLIYVFLLPLWLLRGRAYFEEQVATRATPKFETLPYNNELVTYLREQRALGRKIVLATNSHSVLAKGVSDHLQLFDNIVTIDSLKQQQPNGAFDYVGRRRDDMPLLMKANAVVLVDPDSGVQQAVAATGKPVMLLQSSKLKLKTFAKSIRLYQWMKNLLLFVPLFTSHNWFAVDKLTASVLGFIAFGLCASSIYLLNDLLDLDADRVHPTKRERPLASGTMSLESAFVWFIGLLVAGIALAAWVDVRFLAVLLIYLAITTAYSVFLKQIVLVDVIVLAGLYTIRVIAGAVVVKVEPSFWLLAFSMFLFTSLSLVKRCSELVTLREKQVRSSKGRDYKVADLEYLTTMGTSSGYVAVMVIALYINDDAVRVLYSKPQMLWFLCPLLLYWVSRMWIKTGRGEMHSDPIIYALKDRTSLMVIGGIFISVLLAV
jgi:4-hydroxybenzoate polyprenyltransferase